MEKLLLRVPEASALVSVSETKLRQLIERGDIRAVVIDGVLRVATDDLVAFKDRLRAGAHPVRSDTRNLTEDAASTRRIQKRVHTPNAPPDPVASPARGRK